MSEPTSKPTDAPTPNDAPASEKTLSEIEKICQEIKNYNEAAVESMFSGVDVDSDLKYLSAKDGWFPTPLGTQLCQCTEFSKLSPLNEEFCGKVAAYQPPTDQPLTVRPTSLGSDIAFVFVLAAFVFPMIFKGIRSSGLSLNGLNNKRISKTGGAITYLSFFAIATGLAIMFPNLNVVAIVLAFVQSIVGQVPDYVSALSKWYTGTA